MLDMLYSTYESRLDQLISNLPEQNDQVKIIIIHQTDVSQVEKISALNRSDIKYYQSETRGVTTSRNIAISKSTSEILIFCDDDMVYENGFHESVINYFKNNDIDFATFAIGKGNNKICEKFKAHSYSHKLTTILSVGTVEVVAKRKAILDSMALFPEDMGAGSKYFLCDEPVFLSKLIKHGLVGKYEPMLIGVHPEDSSGFNYSDINAFKSRLMCMTRIFGLIKGVAIYNALLIKNIEKIKPKDIITGFIKVYL